MKAGHQAGLEAALSRAAEARDARLSKRERGVRGVVHTPIEVARFMVARVDRALRRAGAHEGIRGDVTVIDPACGPGVFVAAAREAGARRVLGLDVDADVLEVAGEILAGAELFEGVRLVTHDTLAGPAPLDPEEARARWRVVLGNPPWAGRSANRSATYTERLLDDFRREPDGRPLRERKRGVLSDDYVRFFRWACEEVRGADAGALALVTNSSFLDGPVHRGMRACLMRWFAAIEITDLGGSSLVARGPDRDENLFGVRPGAAVTVAVRAGARDRGAPDPGVEAEVLRGAVRGGTRAQKLARLEPDAVELAPLSPRGPRFAWSAPLVAAPAYESWPALPALMPFHREGVQTNRDAFCVDADRAALIRRLERFAEDGGPQLARAHEPRRHYDPAAARAAITAADLSVEVRRVAYRPFDVRWAALIPKVCHRPRPALLEAMDASELALLTVRKDRGERPWAHFGATRFPVDNCWLSSRSSCRTRAFPTHAPDGSPNLSLLAREWGFASAEALVAYALVFLSSASYRERYDARLRADYPRIPPPAGDIEGLLDAGRAVAAALSVPAHGDSLVVLGHREVRSPPLAEALEAADSAVAEVLARHGR